MRAIRSLYKQAKLWGWGVGRGVWGWARQKAPKAKNLGATRHGDAIGKAGERQGGHGRQSRRKGRGRWRRNEVLCRRQRSGMDDEKKAQASQAKSRKCRTHKVQGARFGGWAVNPWAFFFDVRRLDGLQKVGGFCYVPTMACQLVTGGCGFIGSNLVHELVRRGDEVRVLDNLSTGRLSNLSRLLETKPRQVSLVRGDVLDGPLLDRVLKGVDCVFHLAAVPSVVWSMEQPIACDRVNAGGTLQVLEAARRQGQIRRVVIAASCAAYGDLRPHEPKQETDEVAPLSPYAAAKLASEHWGSVYSRVFDVPTVSLRFFNVFGPRQDPSSHYAAVIPKFVTAALAHKKPRVFGDGLQTRDFVYVDNVVSAMLLACEADAGDVAGHVMNIGCGEQITLLSVLAEISALLGRPIEPDFLPPRPGEARHSLADIGKAKTRLGYVPKVRFAEGLGRTLRFFAGEKEGTA